MAQILITGKDWSARALLRAQLIEEGFDVEAYESVKEVVDRLWGSAEMPSLLIVDLFECEKTAEAMAALSHWAKLVSIWVIKVRSTAGTDTLQAQGFERVLFRPLDIGKLVQEIKERLAG